MGTEEERPKVSYGDIVMHPRKEWPWLGMVQYNSANFVYCRSCGLPKPNFKPKNCGVWAEEEGLEETPKANGVAASIQLKGTASTEEVEDTEMTEAKDSAAVCECDEAPDCCEATPPPASPVPDGKWQILWYPSLQPSSSDGEEIVVYPCTQERYFQEGHAVYRPGNSRRGIIKRIKQQMDGFLLPDLKWVATDLPCHQPDDFQLIDQQAGSYVIKDGWIGSVYGTWNKVRFRMEDGREFWVKDENQESSLYFSERMSESRNMPLDSYQMYPGMEVRAPYLVLKTAQWVDPEFRPSTQLQAQISLSEKLWSSSNYDSVWWIPEEDTEARKAFERELLEASEEPIQSAKAVVETKEKDETPKPYNWKTKLVRSNRSRATWTVLASPSPEGVEMKEEPSERVEEEPMEIEDPRQKQKEPEKKQPPLLLTVVEVQPTKLDVEWRNQIEESEEQTPPGSDVVGEEEFDKLKWFKVPSYVALSKGLSARAKVRIGRETEIISREEYRRRELGTQTEQPKSSERPAIGADAYVYLISGKCLLEILWEDGEMEKGVPAVNVNSAPLAMELGGRDYFPGMYVLYLRRVAEERQERNRFGLVLRSNNQEKFAAVRWFRWEKGSEPLAELEEEVSFYDIKSHPEFNYVNGSLVSRLNVPPSASVPNVGYVVQKLAEGSVLVKWFDGSESSCAPWLLCKLKMESGGGYAESGESILSEEEAEEAEPCYSPTEHEYDDLEDLRYYEYMSLPETERWERVALLVEALEPMLELMARLLARVHRHFPLLERRPFVKMALHCDDVISGFAHLGRFKTCIEAFYTERLGLDPAQPVPSAKNGAHSACTNALLIWNVATWLYDWLEVTQELDVAIGKQRAEHGTKKKKTDACNTCATACDTSAIACDTSAIACDTSAIACDTSATACKTETASEQQQALLGKISEWQSSVQAVFTTVSRVLGHGQPLASTVPLVFECSASLRDSLKEGGEEPATETLKEAHRFLRLFVTQSKRVEKLPCFAYNLPPDGDIKALAKAWKTLSISDYHQQSGSGGDGDGVDVIGKMIQRLEGLSGEQLCFTPEEIVPFIHDMADALSLSIVLVLSGIVSNVRRELALELERLRADAAIAKWGETLVEREKEDIDFGEEVLSPASFSLAPSVPATHRFISKTFDTVVTSKPFLSAVRRELKLLRTALPPGISVRAYEDRMDLFSCMIHGPADTPYEGGLFFFDVRLKADFPSRPPHVFFKSMSKRLNPNLYEDGMVCLSLLGTWDGKESELWTPSSTLLQVFLSIQSLVLVAEPYFNEPGYEKEKGSEKGTEKSRDYNESAILLTLESIQRVCQKAPEPFEEEVRLHFRENLPRLKNLLERYQGSEDFKFPLLPVTQGFRLCIDRHAKSIEKLIRQHCF